MGKFLFLCLSAGVLFGCAQPQAEVQAPEFCTMLPFYSRTYLMFFDPGSARLTPRGAQVTDVVAIAFHRVDGTFIELRGYMDGQEAAMGRAELSAQRAAAVKARLVEDGIDPQRILTQGLGATHPLVPVDSAEAQNRRVEPRLYGADGGTLTQTARQECRTWVHDHCFRAGRAPPGNAASCDAAWDASPRW